MAPFIVSHCLVMWAGGGYGGEAQQQAVVLSHTPAWARCFFFFFCSPGGRQAPSVSTARAAPPHLRVTSQISLGLTALWCGQIVTKGGPGDWETRASWRGDMSLKSYLPNSWWRVLLAWIFCVFLYYIQLLRSCLTYDGPVTYEKLNMHNHLFPWQKSALAVPSTLSRVVWIKPANRLPSTLSWSHTF